MTTADSLGPGALLADRYRLGRCIGRGGMADVYVAQDELLQRTVAIKAFRLDTSRTAERRRIDAEMRVLAGLRHPGLVTLFDAHAGDDDAGTAPYLVMEYVEGATLSHRLDDGPLSQTATARIGIQLADALSYVHGLGLVHRDVKPANILLEAGGEDEAPVVRLADFGIARLVDSTTMTGDGLTVGTANYLSPEQARGAPVGPPSDVYALGLVLIECLTGRIAFPGSGVEAAVARLSRAPDVPADLPAGWQDLLTAMTRSEPDQRPELGAVRAVLAAAGGGATVTLPATPAGATSGSTAVLPVGAGSAPSATPVTTALATGAPPSERRRNRVRAGYLVAAAAVAAALVVAVAATASDPSDPEPTPTMSVPQHSGAPSTPATSPAISPVTSDATSRASSPPATSSTASTGATLKTKVKEKKNDGPGKKPPGPGNGPGGPPGKGGDK